MTDSRSFTGSARPDYNAMAHGPPGVLRDLAIEVMSQQTGNRRLMALCEAAIAAILAQPVSVAQSAPDYRQALENARQEIVLAIAFLGRDIATKRLDITATQLCIRLANADAAIRRTLAAPQGETV